MVQKLQKHKDKKQLKNDKALNIHNLKLYSPLIIGGRSANKIASPITIGVYTFANLVINLSD